MKNEGYYHVKFYNHSRIVILFWNGDRFESFKSDQMPNDEIEWYQQITVDQTLYTGGKR